MGSGSGFGDVYLARSGSQSGFVGVTGWVGLEVSVIPFLTALWVAEMMVGGDLVPKCIDWGRVGSDWPGQVRIRCFYSCSFSASCRLPLPLSLGFTRTLSLTAGWGWVLVAYIKTRFGCVKHISLCFLLLSDLFFGFPLELDWVGFYFWFQMESDKLSFKSVLCADPPVNDMNMKSVEGGAAGDAGVRLEPPVLPSLMTDPQGSESNKKIDVAGFMSKLATVN